jgi:hypothetical protein
VFFVPYKVGGGDWQVVQKETCGWVQVEVVDMMIGTYIDGVFMDMQATSVIRDNARDIEEGEEMLATKVEQMDAIVDIEALENDGGVFAKLD